MIDFLSEDLVLYCLFMLNRYLTHYISLHILHNVIKSDTKNYQM